MYRGKTMIKQDDPSTVRPNGDVPRGASWLRKRCAAAAAALLLAGGATTAHAVNGEQSGVQGYFTPPPEVCTASNIVLCNDNTLDEGILSCHQRSGAVPPVDEGLAVGLCTDTITILESGQSFTTEIISTSATAINCYDDGVFDVCDVCATYVDGFGDGRRSCIQIANDASPAIVGTTLFEAFTIRSDATACAVATTALAAAVFTAPAVGWTISDDAGTIGAEFAKEVILCADRGFTPFVGDNGVVRGPEGYVSINTPYCYRSRTGRRVCF